MPVDLGHAHGGKKISKWLKSQDVSESSSYSFHQRIFECLNWKGPVSKNGESVDCCLPPDVEKICYFILRVENRRHSGQHKATVQDSLGDISEDCYQDGCRSRGLHRSKPVTQSAFWRA